MKTPTRHQTFVGLKLPSDLAEEVRRQADEDDRTVSGYLRRIIAAAVRRANERKRESESR